MTRPMQERANRSRSCFFLELIIEEDGESQLQTFPQLSYIVTDGNVVKLLKSLYGLKQAAHKFKEHLNNTLSAMGFKRLCSDSSVYLGVKILVTSHVDDLLFLSPNADVVQELSKTYNMKFPVNATGYLGCTITRNEKENTISLSREAFKLISSEIFYQNISHSFC